MHIRVEVARRKTGESGAGVRRAPGIGGEVTIVEVDTLYSTEANISGTAAPQIDHSQEAQSEGPGQCIRRHLDRPETAPRRVAQPRTTIPLMWRKKLSTTAWRRCRVPIHGLQTRP